MSETKTIKCPVESPEAYGEYANAFRILSAGGSDLFLDFCVYSEQSHKAKVVARVRCRPEFLTVMMDRLQTDTTPPENPDPNRLFFILPGALDEN